MTRETRHTGQIAAKVAGYAVLVAVTGCMVIVAARQVVRLVGVVAPSVGPALQHETRRLASEYEEVRRFVRSKEAQASSELRCVHVALTCLAEHKGS